MVAKFLDHNNRELKQRNDDGNKNGKKNNMLRLAKQQRCTSITFVYLFVCLFFCFLHFLDVVARPLHETY